MKNSIFATILAVVISFNDLSSQTIRSVFYVPTATSTPDSDQYIEIQGTPNGSLNGYWLLSIRSDAGNRGIISVAIDLSAFSLGSNGLILIRNSSVTFNTDNPYDPAPDVETTLINSGNGANTIPDSSNTFLLVTNFTGMEGDDIDTDNNNVLDSAPWDSVEDAITVLHSSNTNHASYANAFGGVILTYNGTTPPDGFVLNDGAYLAFQVTGTASGGPYTIANLWDESGSSVTGFTSTTLTPGDTKAPLPIELVAFAGRKVGSQVQLYWETATEKNNALMEIERSADGQVFSKIGEKKPYGDGNSLALQRYEFTDYQPLPGLNYYRLRQLDLGGKDTYHKTIAILFDEVKNEEGVRVFPSPAAETLHFALAQETTATGTIRVLDMSGRAMLQLPLPIGIQQDQMDISSLPQGQYILSIQAGRTSYNIKFAKL